MVVLKTWRARTTRNAIGQLVLLIIPVGVLGFCAELLWDGVTAERLVGVTLALALTAGVCLWAYRASRHFVQVELVGDTLGIQGRGTHKLGPSSLMAVRAKDTHGSTMGTYVSVALNKAASRVTLLFPGAVPNDAYFAETEMRPDMWLDPEANALLDALVPYLACKPGSDPTSAPGYGFALRRSLLALRASADSLSIAGDNIAVGCDGRIVARARSHEIAFTVYCFERSAGGDSPSMPNAPALVLEYLNPPFKVTLGAEPMSLEAHWDQLTVGEKPDYMMGLGELLRLIAVLEAGRAKFARR